LRKSVRGGTHSGGRREKGGRVETVNRSITKTFSIMVHVQNQHQRLSEGGCDKKANYRRDLYFAWKGVKGGLKINCYTVYQGGAQTKIGDTTLGGGPEGIEY